MPTLLDTTFRGTYTVKVYYHSQIPYWPITPQSMTTVTQQFNRQVGGAL